MTRRGSLRLLLSLTLALVFAGAALPSLAVADEDQGDREITRYEVAAIAQPDGTIDVTLEIDFDFATTPGHGLYLTLLTRQEIAGDPDHYRVIEVSGIAVSSTTGAPDDLFLEEGDNAVAIRIGDEDIDDVSGVQTYRVTYTLAGVINSGAGAAGQDEIYWNFIRGGGFELPVSNVSVTLDGPVPVEQIDCFTGRVGSDDRCSGHVITDGVATFRQDYLPDGQGLSLVASFPAGTFGGVEPILAPRRTFTNTMGFATAAAPTAGIATLLGVGAVALFARRRGRDQAYLGLTPGLTPTDGAGGVGARRKSPIAVQFTPPDGVLPGELGTLTDEAADRRDVTATIVDLAVRGYFRIEEIEGGDKPDWNLVPGGEGAMDRLRPYERGLLRGLFKSTSHKTKLSGLASTRFATAVDDTQDQLYEEMVTRGWFKTSPRVVRATWLGWGVLVVFVGMVLTVGLALLLGWGLLGLAIALVGVAIMVASWFAPARTAEGSAVLAQALGFRRYIETAEANQLRFEAGEDIFSRYLPYAIAFGLEGRWVTIFSDLADQGVELPQPSWYMGTTPAVMLWSGGFGQAMDSFSQAADVAVATATPASSGGSGFSGGFSGGGIGGGGGGGW